MLYLDKIKEVFDKIRVISERNPEELVACADECRERLCEMLDDDGIVLLEQYICCLELLSKSGELYKKK